MTEPGSEQPKRSLTMQRIALERARTFAIVTAVAAAVLLVLALALLFSSDDLVFHLVQLASFIALLVLGVRRLAAAREALREFEDENGPGAGGQKPVR